MSIVMAAVVNLKPRFRERHSRVWHTFKRADGGPNGTPNGGSGGSGSGSLALPKSSSQAKSQAAAKPPLEPIKEASSDSALPEPDDAPLLPAPRPAAPSTPQPAGLAVVKHDMHRRWARKTLYVLDALDRLQCKLFEYFWVSVLYANILFPRLLRVTRYVSLQENRTATSPRVQLY